MILTEISIFDEAKLGRKIKISGRARKCQGLVDGEKGTPCSRSTLRLPSGI
jgi:hypothetical protein